MCGRYTLSGKVEEISARLGIRPLAMPPRYNIAPGQDCLVILHREGQHAMESLRWGLVPKWAKEEKSGYKMINARAESVAEKPAFKNLLVHHRCLVPADGWYEWQRSPSGKTPYRLCLGSGSPFAFAGLWSAWQRPAREWLRTFTIITTAASKRTAQIHDRMPAILNPHDYETWLDPAYRDRDRLQSLLTPYEGDDLISYPVSTRVNTPKNDDPECIKPANPPESQSERENT